MLSPYFEGARKAGVEGELSADKLRDLYAALLDNSFRLDKDDDTIAFYRRLRIGKVLGARAGPKRALRTRKPQSDNLDDNIGIPVLLAGMTTRSVANDCNGRVGIAK